MSATSASGERNTGPSPSGPATAPAVEVGRPPAAKSTTYQPCSVRHVRPRWKSPWVRMACDGTCSARSSREQLLHVGPLEHVRRRAAAATSSIAAGPLADVPGAPAEGLVEAEVHARRHGAEAVGLGPEVAAGELGRAARGVEVAHRREGQGVARRRTGRGTPAPRRGRARHAARRHGAARWLKPDFVEGEEQLEIGARARRRPRCRR